MTVRPMRPALEAASCRGCGKSSILVAKALGACGDCIRQGADRVVAPIAELHGRVRRTFGLPAQVPRAADGIACKICVHECRIPQGELGLCGLRTVQEGRLVHLGGMPGSGILEWYYDPLPTNCVGMWCCAEKGTCGGFKNLAVFYGGCSANCLFCQNWQHRRLAARRWPRVSAQELVAAVDDATACICFFGGDPTPQMPHSIAVAELAFQEQRQRPLRICWETNGSMNPAYLRRAAHLAMQSGGTIKFDLKAWDENLHLALTGFGNRRTLENFRWLAEVGRPRLGPPLVMASTLLVPGYVDQQEVRQIAAFIASLDRRIPYSLLAFHPHFFLSDLPSTSWRHARTCLEAAREAGLANVRLGNIPLLSELY